MQHTRCLSSPLASGRPPTEFRIFAAGVNETMKGPSVFDATAAESVMAAYRKHGVDLMIDLEHESLDETPARADSRDARGWFKLELRNGELWAVDVRYTPDGEARLREKRQRYISPAFVEDAKTNRVERLVNVAICAMPATHHAAPLVAASLARSASDVVSARLPHAQSAAFRAASAKLGLAPGQMLRLLAAVATLAKEDKVLATIREALELAPGAKLQEILDAITKAYGPADAPAPAKAKPAPAPSDNALAGAAATLTRAEREYIARHRITPAELAARKACAVRTEGARAPALARAPKKLTRAEEAYCRTHNLTREQFEARKADAVKGR